MEVSIQEFLTTGVFTFIVIFVRLGSAIMIMPGVGDSFISARVRLLFALGLSLALSPLLGKYMPYPLPGTVALFVLIMMEFMIGVFFGTIARIFMIALDVAGMVTSMQSGLGSAQLFNPTLATQGSLIGAFFSVTGVTFLFATNLHHLLFMGLVESYEFFPVGNIPDTGSMAEFMSMALSASFSIGVKMATPFIVITLLIYAGMGVLTRLMPQVQVFMIALPLQIIVSLVTMAAVISGIYLFWSSEFENGISFFLTSVQ